MTHLVDPASLTTGAILAVADADGTLKVVDPASAEAMAFQLDRPVRRMKEMIWRDGPRGRRRSNVDIYRCYGVVCGRRNAVTIAVSTKTVPTVESLQDWPVPALIGARR